MPPEHQNGHAGETEAQNLGSAEKRRKAVRLRRDGHSYRSIAKFLECSAASAHAYIKAELDELRAETRESAEQLRDIEIAKLDDLEQKLRKRLSGCDDQDAAKITAVIVKITESRRKLLGLDAPQRVEHSGNLYAIQEASPDCAAWSLPAKVAELSLAPSVGAPASEAGE